jgi:hypothetical protein
MDHRVKPGDDDRDWYGGHARGDLSAVAQQAKAEATKQSLFLLRGEMNCFAEPVIGRAFAPSTSSTVPDAP